MADIKANSPVSSNAFKEAVCIDAGRVYDSCCDRDCLEDMRCFFGPRDQEYVEGATSVRVRSAEVLDVFIDVEPVTFNRGFYSCDIVFYFLIEVELFGAPHCKPRLAEGIAFYEKKVILFGSEGNVKTFSNAFTREDGTDPQAIPTSNMPKCVVQCVDPIVLSSRLCELRDCFDNIRSMPCGVCNRIGGTVETGRPSGTPTVYVTLGLFTIIQLIRNVQMLIPVYDFCIPEKQCEDSTDQPCDVFKKIKFPNDDFFPPRPLDPESGCGCH